MNASQNIYITYTLTVSAYYIPGLTEEVVMALVTTSLMRGVEGEGTMDVSMVLLETGMMGKRYSETGPNVCPRLLSI